MKFFWGAKFSWIGYILSVLNLKFLQLWHPSLIIWSLRILLGLHLQTMVSRGAQKKNEGGSSSKATKFFQGIWGCLWCVACWGGRSISQEGHPNSFYSEKLNEAKWRYLAYDMDFYALIQTLKHWWPYLIHREFILYTHHDSLKHLHTQNKLSPKHAWWMEYL